MKSIKIVMTILLMMVTVMVSAQRVITTSDAGRKVIAKKTLALDYSMPDYSIDKIDASVMGLRLAKILETISRNYTQHHYLCSLSSIQSSQVDGLDYGSVKSMKLGNVTKSGEKLIIRYNTTLESNNLNLKKSQLVFRFVNGVSENPAINDLFTDICRYIKTE